MMSRHSWISHKNGKNKYWICSKCGCQKERYYGTYLYFPVNEDLVYSKANKCEPTKQT